MGLRFRRSVKLFPGVRLNLGLGGASVSVGGRGATMNVSGKGVRTTLGLPGTGVSYTVASPSGRRLTHRQAEAAFRRAAVDARRHEALAQVESEDADLEAVLGSWRDVPELPTGEDYRRRATATEPFTFEEAPPPWPDEQAAHQALMRELAGPARGSAPDLGVAFLVAIGGLLAGMLLAATCGAMMSVVWGLALGAGAAMAGVGLAIAIGSRGRAASRASELIGRRRAIEAAWEDHWRSVQTKALHELHAWEERRDAERAAWDDEQAERAARARRLLEGDVTAIEEDLTWAIGDLGFDFEAQCRVTVPNSKEVYLLVDLPEIEDLMPETRTKVFKNGSTREVKRPKAERLAGYAQVVCGLAFQLSRTAFAVTPTLEQVHIAAYTQRRQKRTGAVADDFVYDVTVARAVTRSMDFRSADPVVEIQRLPGRIKRADSGELGKITAPEWLEA